MKKKSDRTLLLLAVFGIVLFFVINWWPAITGSSDDTAEPMPKITKHQALETAESFVAKEYGGRNLDRFIVYQSNKTLEGYLQKNKLYKQYMKKYDKHFPLSFYQVELVDELLDIRYLVDVDAQKNAIIGWKKTSSNMIPRDETNYQIAAEAAESLGYHVEEFKLRKDYTYHGSTIVFVHKNDVIGETRLQLFIKVVNQEIVSFHPEFPVPNEFIQWSKKQDRWGGIMSTGSLLLSFVMALAAIFIAVKSYKWIDNRRGAVLSILFLVFYCVNNVNMYPGFKSIVMNEAGSSFGAIFSVIFSNFTIILMAASLYLSLISGESLWRQEGRRLWPSWKDPQYGNHLVSSMGRGYLVCLIVLGVQSALFLIAQQYFGMWSTSDVSSSTYNMIWPILFPLLAWCAAISEEGIYRLFGIAFFKKLFRNRFIAVLIPSMIWALGHTTYPIYPVYTRFVEVTILGFIFSYAFLRYGFITSLFAHAIMDSILMSISLIGMGDPLHVLTGLFYIALPAIIAYVLKALHGSIHRTDGFRRSSLLPPEEQT